MSVDKKIKCENKKVFGSYNEISKVLNDYVSKLSCSKWGKSNDRLLAEIERFKKKQMDLSPLLSNHHGLPIKKNINQFSNKKIKRASDKCKLYNDILSRIRIPSDNISLVRDYMGFEFFGMPEDLKLSFNLKSKLYKNFLSKIPCDNLNLVSEYMGLEVGDYLIRCFDWHYILNKIEKTGRLGKVALGLNKDHLEFISEKKLREFGFDDNTLIFQMPTKTKKNAFINCIIKRLEEKRRFKIIFYEWIGILLNIFLKSIHTDCNFDATPPKKPVKKIKMVKEDNDGWIIQFNGNINKKSSKVFELKLISELSEKEKEEYLTTLNNDLMRGRIGDQLKLSKKNFGKKNEIENRTNFINECCFLMYEKDSWSANNFSMRTFYGNLLKDKIRSSDCNYMKFISFENAEIHLKRIVVGAGFNENDINYDYNNVRGKIGEGFNNFKKYLGSNKFFKNYPKLKYHDMFYSIHTNNKNNKISKKDFFQLRFKLSVFVRTLINDIVKENKDDEYKTIGEYKKIQEEIKEFNRFF